MPGASPERIEEMLREAYGDLIPGSPAREARNRFEVRASRLLVPDEESEWVVIDLRGCHECEEAA